MHFFLNKGLRVESWPEEMSGVVAANRSGGSSARVLCSDSSSSLSLIFVVMTEIRAGIWTFLSAREHTGWLISLR